MKLTKRSIETLPSGDKRLYHYDDELPGFGVVVQPTGVKSFFVQYRTSGGRAGASKRMTLGRFPKVTVEQARDLARATLARVVQGGDPAMARQEAKAAMTLETAMAEFLAEHVNAKRKKSTARLYESIVRLYVLPALGKMKVEEVSHRHVARLHHDLRTKPYMANRSLAMLSKFFQWCEQRGYRDRNSNAARGIDKYQEHKRTRFLTDEDLAKIGSAMTTMESSGRLDTFAAAGVRMLLLTGARLNEILTLQWEDIDFELGLAYLRDSKTGAKTIHLGAPALALLESLPRINGWCFPSRRNSGHIVNLRKPFMAVCELAGIEGWRLHDLRHAFASMAASSGQSLPVIGALLGHSQPQTTARYAHIAANPVHKAADATAARIDQALSSGKVVTLQKRKTTAG